MNIYSQSVEQTHLEKSIYQDKMWKPSELVFHFYIVIYTK